MPSHDLTDYLEDDATVLKGIRSRAHPDGHAYTFTSPSAKVGLYLTHVYNLAGKARSGEELSEADAAGLMLDDTEEHDLYRQVMGATFEQMVDDGVSWTTLRQILQLLFRKYAAGQDIDSVLTSSGERKAPANGATQPTVKKTGGKKSRRASGATTRSGSATTSVPTGSSTSPTGGSPHAQAV